MYSLCSSPGMCNPKSLSLADSSFRQHFHFLCNLYMLKSQTIFFSFIKPEHTFQTTYGYDHNYTPALANMFVFALGETATTTCCAHDYTKKLLKNIKSKNPLFTHEAAFADVSLLYLNAYLLSKFSKTESRNGLKPSSCKFRIPCSDSFMLLSQHINQK